MRGRHSLLWPALVLMLIALGLFVGACGGGGQKAVAASGIPQQIICPCSCDTVLSACQPGCSLEGRLKEIIGSRLESGQSNEQILQYFVNMYGEEVLAPGTRFESQTY